MFYVGIDQHRRQLTVCVRNEQGDLVLLRQVSTEWERVRAFMAQLREQSGGEGGFAVILEVCGFNDWLLEMLAEYGCREIVLLQAEERSRKKTDRRARWSCYGSTGIVYWQARRHITCGVFSRPRWKNRRIGS